jgi:large subunit ribosomal protein L25
MELEHRTVKGSKIRSKDLTPGVLYGHGIESIAVQAKSNDFQKMYKTMGTSKTFEVTLEGKKHIVYIKQTQSFSENHNIKSHFDLVKVSKDDTMTSKINVVFVNHQEVEKRGLIVQTVLSTIDVEYAVGAGISNLELDVKGLQENDTLLVSDIKVPNGVTIIDDMDSVVVTISSPKEEVEAVEGEEIITEVTSLKQSNE